MGSPQKTDRSIRGIQPRSVSPELSCKRSGLAAGSAKARSLRHTGHVDDQQSVGMARLARAFSFRIGCGSLVAAFLLAFLFSYISDALAVAVFFISLILIWLAAVFTASPNSGRCPHCRKLVKFDATICSHCGNTLPTSSPAAPARSSPAAPARSSPAAPARGSGYLSRHYVTGWKSAVPPRGSGYDNPLSTHRPSPGEMDLGQDTPIPPQVAQPSESSPNSAPSDPGSESAPPGGIALSALAEKEVVDWVTPDSPDGKALQGCPAPAQPGWYPDPVHDGFARYCRGAHWTGERRKILAGAPAPEPVASPEPVAFCLNCGAVFVECAQFCGQCGVARGSAG